MAERMLAHIEEIVDIQPIENADAIEVVTVLGWHCVVAKKDNFKIGDKVVYVEIDSRVPDRPEFEFLRDRNFKVKTIKLRGQISQGLVVPMSIFGSRTKNFRYAVSTDVTEVLGITKILSKSEEEDKVIYKSPKNKFYKYMMRYAWFRILWKKLNKPEAKGFPSWIVKTDEERIQNIPKVLINYADDTFTVTEKLDGQSCTLFIKDKLFGVCSRNQLLPKSNNSSWWTIANQIDYITRLTNIKNKLNANRVVIQGEIIGNGIQGNKYKIDGYELRVFNLIVDGKKFMRDEMLNIIHDEGLELVPLIDDNFKLLNTVDEMVEYSKGNSTLLPIKREGCVIRSNEHDISFKVINPDFLLKYDN